MNVTCPNCATIYRVDPAKIPEGGVRARCNVCSAVFAVRREGEAQIPPPAPVTRREPAPVESVRPEPPRAKPPQPEPPKAEPITPPAPKVVIPSVPSRRTAPAAGGGSAAPPRPAAPQRPTIGGPPPAAPPAVGAGASAARPVPPPPAAPPARSAPAMPPAPASPPPPRSPALPAQSTPPATPKPGPAPSGAGTRPQNPFLSQDPALKARRLARALISDMVVYHPGKRQEGLRDGNLKELFEEEIKKSWEEYAEQVGREIADSTGYFKEALNEILAGGRQIF
jgi:predicted Zn finger-like uncharacterized protein